MPADTQEIDTEVSAILAGEHNDLPPAVRVDSGATEDQPATTTTSSAGELPSFTIEDLPNILKDSDFMALEPDERLKRMRYAIGSAYSNIQDNGGLSQDDYKEFRKLADNMQLRAGPSISEDETAMAKFLPEAAWGMVKDIGAGVAGLFMGASDPDSPTQTEIGKTQGEAIGQAFTGRGASYQQTAYELLPEGRAVSGELEKIKAAIDNGDHVANPPKFFAESGAAIQKTLPAYLGIENTDPSLANRGLNDPKAAMALNLYAATGDESAWKDFRSEVLKTDWRKQTEADKQALLKSPGAKQFENVFGEGSAQHLVAGSDPVMAAAMVIPALRGAGKLEAAGASTLGKVGKTVAEQAAFGLDAAVQENPDLTVGDAAQSAAKMIALGTAIHGASWLAKQAIKGEPPPAAAPATESVEGDTFAAPVVNQSLEDMLKQAEAEKQAAVAPPVPVSEPLTPVPETPAVPPSTLPEAKETPIPAPPLVQATGQASIIAAKFDPGAPKLVQQAAAIAADVEAKAGQKAPAIGEVAAPTPEAVTEPSPRNPITIFRAGDANEVGVKPFSSWTPDKSTAETYQDNPGFGGETLRSLRVDAGDILDADTTNRNGMRKIAEELGFDAGEGENWFDNGWRYPWEESSKVKRALEESEFTAVRYKDDFPEGATTIIFTHEPKIIADRSPAAQHTTEGLPSTIQISRGQEGQRGDAEIQNSASNIQPIGGSLAEASLGNKSPLNPTGGEPPPPVPAVPIEGAAAATTPPEGTSNKDAVTLAERRASGILTDPEQAAPISHQEILDQGRADIKAAQESGKPSPAREIAARLRSATAEDRTISRRENGILMAERRQTRNDQIDASKVIADPSATPAAKAVAKADWDAAEAKIAELNQAAKDAGGVWGGWGAFRKQVIAEDWSFDKLQSDQQAQLGRPLEKDEADALKKIADEHKANSAVVAKNAELTQENQRLTEQNANLQSMLDKAGAKREPKSESKTPRDYVPPKKPLGANFIAKSSARRADIAKEISELLKTTNIGVNPVIAAKAAEYMGHLIAEGAVKFAQVAVKMKDEFKDLFDDTELMAMFESAKAHAKKLAANADRDIAGERAATLAGLKQRIAEGDPKSDLGRYANAIARQFIDEGIHELEPLNAAVHGALKEVMPEITLREAEDAWNGYGIWKELDKSPEKVIYRQLKNEGLKLSAWQDLQKSPGFKKKTGRASEPPTAKARKQDQENREYMRRHGINAADPETQAKGALDAIKTRLRNKKADLDFARATGQRIVDKTGVAYDTEAKQLKDEADAAQILYDAVFPKEPISDAETLRRATIVAEKELENWRAKLKDAERGIFAKRQGPMSTVPGERLSQIKSEIGAMEAEVAHLKDIDSMFQEQAAQEKLQKTGDALEKKLRDGETALENDPAFGPDSAAVTALKARNDAIRKLIADAKDKGDDARTTAALEKSIADLSDKLARGEYEAKQRKASFPDTERNARLREERDALRGFLADVRRGPKKSKDEIRLSAMIAGAARRKANLLDRIATKNFKPTPKKPPPNANTAKLKQMESDLRAARLRNVKIERDYNNAKAKYELENEPAWRWLSRQGGRFARAAVLASAKIYTKLAMLGWVVKPFATLAEETLGATGARMLLPETMRNAPGEGTGSTLLERMSDYARGYRRGFAEMKTAELEGQTTNQSLHSDQGKFDTAPHWEDYLLTHPHMAIKAPAWEAAFSMSEGNRIRHAGYTDLRQVPPEELANLQKEAAKDADHHIAINENKMNKMVSEGLGVLERQGAAGTVAADLLRMDAPIRKIPTNIAAGGGKYLFGSLAAPIKMAWLKKYRAGEITPEDYNNVARTMKKGMTFATLAAIAAVVPGAIKVGGVYVRDEKKRKPGDLKPNEMEILGVKIPEAIGHADIGAAAQAAGTAVRAFQKHREGGGGVVMSSLDGVSQAALGLTQDLPAIKVAGDVGEAWKAGEGAKSTASRLAKNVIPFPVRFAAEQQDYKGDQSVLQQLLMGADKDNIIYRGASFQTGIPDIGLGLPSRQDLPRKKSKR